MKPTVTLLLSDYEKLENKADKYDFIYNILISHHLNENGVDIHIRTWDEQDNEKYIRAEDTGILVGRILDKIKERIKL